MQVDRKKAAQIAQDTLRIIENRCYAAWGCGVFGNDTEEVAQLFRDALLGKYAAHFGRIAFAVTDWSPEERFIGPFRAVFGSSSN